jgi:hypothetical protein
MGKRNAESQAQSQGTEPPPPERAVQQQAAPDADEGGVSAQALQRLRELAELHKQGVLTDEEFAAQKARILD